MSVKGKTPSLLTGSAGTPSVIQAGARRKCSRCESVITKGETCIKVPKPQLHSGYRTFCSDCFRDVYKQTETDLVTLGRKVWPRAAERPS